MDRVCERRRVDSMGIERWGRVDAMGIERCGRVTKTASRLKEGL